MLQSKAQRLCSVTGSPGFSQAWVWTRAAWFNLISDKKQQAFGTPLGSTSTPHNIISSSTQRVRSTVAVRGEICFHFTTSVARKTIQMLLYCLHYCSLVWISLFSLFRLCQFSPSTHTQGVPWWLRPITSKWQLHNRAECPQWYHSVHHIPKSRSVQDKQDLVVSTQFTSVCYKNLI